VSILLRGHLIEAHRAKIVVDNPSRARLADFYVWRNIGGRGVVVPGELATRYLHASVSAIFCKHRCAIGSFQRFPFSFSRDGDLPVWQRKRYDISMLIADVTGTAIQFLTVTRTCDE
jgi:hypothetical protein